jgi:Cu(I)/Ag(I) efflux system membrane fusion protein
MNPGESNPQRPAERPRRRRGLFYVAVAVGTAALLLLLWQPIVAWFTGKPMGRGSSETVSSRAGNLTVEAALRPDPPRQEGNSILLTVLGPEGRPVEDAEVEVALIMPAMGAMAEMRGKADVNSEGEGRYRAGFDLQMVGTWNVVAEVRSPVGTAAARYTLTVGRKGLTPVESGSAAPAARGESALASRDLPAASLAPLRTAFAAYEETRALLAEDRLDELEVRAGRIAGSLAAARQSFAEGNQDVVQWLEQGERAAARLASARSLEDARQAFADVSRILIGLALCDPRLAEGLHLFWCPMTSGFNRWVQTSPEIENPYMGTAMRSCGSALEWAPAPAAVTSAGGDEISHYTCSMHPSVRKAEPGTCPICNMDLVAVTREQAASGEVVIAPEQQQLIGVRSSRVERRAVESEIRAVGRVAFDETRFEDVTVKYGGYIGRLHVEETGQPVRKGQTLFTLYSPELYAAQQEFLLALASQRAARQTAVPDRADYLVQAARQKLRLWDFSDSQVSALASRGTPAREVAVPSPASGYVVEKDVVEGAAVQPGMRLFRLAALDRVWIEAEVYESELPRVRLGQRATVTLPYLKGQELRGRVSRILPALDPESRTGRVRIEIANRSGAGGPLLRPEMFADVALEAPAREALMVPESAVLYTGPRRLVLLDLGQGRFRPKEVRLGARSGDFYEVLAGLEESDRVVTAGNFLVDAEARLQTGGQVGGQEHASH